MSKTEFLLIFLILSVVILNCLQLFHRMVDCIYNILLLWHYAIIIVAIMRYF